MARKKKPSGRLIDGPFTADHFDRALKLDGWILAAKLEHWHYQHPDRPGKPQVDPKWQHVKSSHWAFKGVCSQAGYSKRRLLELLNSVR